MRISTKEERGKQKFTRQEQAIARWCKENNTEISERRIYKDDASGKSFERKAWRELESDIQPGDTIVFKDICRFTREYENGYEKYMELLNKGVNLVFIDNPTISTDYIINMMGVVEKQKNRIAKKSLRDTIELLILVELDRAEQEREITVKRIKDGIAASDKKSGRKTGNVDKLTDELRIDIQAYLHDRSIKQIDLIKKHNISRNTLKKYAEIIKNENQKGERSK
jgi:DNA invertase Pin-like site-specific DNA recombinase